MRGRHTISRSKSRKSFKRSASRTHRNNTMNPVSGLMRGGIRL